MSPAEERQTPSEAAVREQLREESGPRASSAPAQGQQADAPSQEEGAPGGGVQDEGGFVDAPAGSADDEANPGAVESPPGQDGAEGAATEAGGSDPSVDQADPLAQADTDPLAEAERRRDEYLSLAQRTQAEFDNYRRRAAREAAAASTRAKAGLVRELLPALDNLERALAATGDIDDGFARGVQMVHAEIVGALERNGVAAFEPSGEPFDPNVHEALSTRPADGTDPGVVVDVVEKGYRLEETVLRPARVIVSA